MSEQELPSAPEDQPDTAGLQLRRRQNRPVEFERRRRTAEGFDIAAALELYLDQCKTRRAMNELLEGWLAEARNRDSASQDPSYIRAVERAIDVMRHAPDVQTAIITLQAR